MSHPWTSPAELAKYTVLPEMATEFSMLNWRSLMSDSSSASQLGVRNTTSGSTVTRPSGP